MGVTFYLLSFPGDDLRLCCWLTSLQTDAIGMTLVSCDLSRHDFISASLSKKYPEFAADVKTTMR
jgi:hypothetical protein